eukprot:127552_1
MTKNFAHNLFVYLVLPAELLGNRVQDSEHGGGHHVGLLVTVDVEHDVTLLVEVLDGTHLLMEHLQALGDDLLLVIAALDQGLAGDVVSLGDLRGSELLVVGATTGAVQPAATGALNQDLVRDLEHHDSVELLTHGLELLALVRLRGTPSRMYPSLHSGFLMASPTMPKTISSLTSLPVSMASLAKIPLGVLL